MRPRGPSSSSPSNWYVGQVAVQKPQCTHLRRMASASRPSAVPANSGERWVCTSEVGEQAAGVGGGGRIELLFQLALDAIERRLRRREARDVGGTRGAEQGRVATCCTG